MSQKIGIVFPGQGSQKVGMGLDFFNSFDLAKDYFKLADQHLGYCLSQLCFEGPKETLTLTIHAQPALYIVSCIIHDLLKDRGVSPFVYAGHSLGEITAYYGSGLISFTQGLDIIAHRAKSMLSAYPSDDSGMAAIIGLNPNHIHSLIDHLSDIPVVCANYNAPLQTVISGKRNGVLDASNILKENKAKVIPLPVSGAFHSPLMQSASDSLSQFMQTQSLQPNASSIILNQSGVIESDLDKLHQNISKQVISSVRWVDSMMVMSQLVDAIFELGSGQVLTGLIKKINPDISCTAVNTVDSFKNLILLKEV